MHLVGSVADKDVIIVDDMIDTAVLLGFFYNLGNIMWGYKSFKRDGS